MKMDELVAKYIELRDKKAEFKKEYEAKVADTDRLLGKIEAVFLQKFNAEGTDSIKTAAGTAFKSLRSSASVADRDAFFAYIKANDAYELLEARCNKTAVAQHKAANDELPPGVNWSEEVTVNIRRSA